MIPFKSLIVRLFEGKGRGEKKKKVGHRSNHDSRNYVYKSEVERYRCACLSASWLLF